MRTPPKPPSIFVQSLIQQTRRHIMCTGDRNAYIFPDNLRTDKLEYKSSGKTSLQSGWIIEDNKTNINFGTFLLRDKLYPLKETLKIL